MTYYFRSLAFVLALSVCLVGTPSLIFAAPRPRYVRKTGLQIHPVIRVAQDEQQATTTTAATETTREPGGQKKTQSQQTNVSLNDKSQQLSPNESPNQGASNISSGTNQTDSKAPSSNSTQSFPSTQLNETMSITSTLVDHNATKNNKTIVHNDTDSAAKEDADFEAARKATGSISGFLAEARAQHERIMSGGFIEVIEWLFVFLLVAPGTFPAIGCVLYGCTSLMHRRFGGIGSTPPTSSNGSNMSLASAGSNNMVGVNLFNHNGQASNDDGMHPHMHAVQHTRQAAHRSAVQRNSLLDSSALLTARTRHKAFEERDDP